MSDQAVAYRRGGTEERVRVMLVMPKAEMKAIDAWGVPAGMPSRTATIRTLIQRGLEAVTRLETGGAQTAGTGS